MAKSPETTPFNDAQSNAFNVAEDLVKKNPPRKPPVPYNASKYEGREVPVKKTVPGEEWNYKIDMKDNLTWGPHSPHSLQEGPSVYDFEDHPMSPVTDDTVDLRTLEIHNETERVAKNLQIQSCMDSKKEEGHTAEGAVLVLSADETPFLKAGHAKLRPISLNEYDRAYY